MQPLPVIIIQGLDTAAQGTTPRNIAIRNLTWVAFFLLLRPGEYFKGSTNTAQHPFRLKDVQFSIVQQPYNAATASKSVLAQADFVNHLFTTYKNGVKVKSIVHSHTVCPQGFPVAVICRRVAYL